MKKTKSFRRLSLILKVIILFLFFGIEYLFRQCSNKGDLRYFLGGVVFAIVVGVLFYFCWKWKICKMPKYSLLRKLVGNMTNSSVTPWLTFFLVLFALIQLEFIYNKAESLMSDFDIISVVQIIVNVLCLYFSTWLYPFEEKKSAEERTLLVSGISCSLEDVLSFKDRHIDALIKPLTLEQCSGLKKMIIIPSFERVKLEPLFENNGCVDFKSFLIKKMENGRPDLLEKIRNIEIEISEPTDYDNYEKCVNTIDKVLKEVSSEYRSDDTFLHITPGTACLSAAFAPFAMTGRAIVYISQKSEEASVFDVEPEGVCGVKAAIKQSDDD